MLQLQKPHNASLFLLLMTNEIYKSLLLMISRKYVRECDKWCRNYHTDIESEEHCELEKNSGKLQVLQPCNKSKPVRIGRGIKNQVECAFVRIRSNNICKKGVRPEKQLEECTRGCTNAKHL